MDEQAGKTTWTCYKSS